MKNKISVEDVKKIGKLSNLNLSEAELTKFSEIFSDTLEYVNVMDELDLSDVDETFSVTGQTNVYQVPGNAQTLSAKECLQNAPHKLRDLFVTNAVFDRGDHE